MSKSTVGRTAAIYADQQLGKLSTRLRLVVGRLSLKRQSPNFQAQQVKIWLDRNGTTHGFEYEAVRFTARLREAALKKRILHKEGGKRKRVRDSLNQGLHRHRHLAMRSPRALTSTPPKRREYVAYELIGVGGSGILECWEKGVHNRGIPERASGEHWHSKKFQDDVTHNFPASSATKLRRTWACGEEAGCKERRRNGKNLQPGCVCSGPFDNWSTSYFHEGDTQVPSKIHEVAKDTLRRCFPTCTARQQLQISGSREPVGPRSEPHPGSLTR